MLQTHIFLSGGVRVYKPCTQYHRPGFPNADDILTRPQKSADGFHVHDHWCVEHAVGFKRDDRCDVVCGDDACRCDADNLAGVLTDLFRVVHQNTDEVEHRVVREMPNRCLPDIARHPLDDSIGLLKTLQPNPSH